MFTSRSLGTACAFLELLILIGAATSHAADVGADFTYQGRLLEDGAAATGFYDFRFRLYDAATDGTQLGEVIIEDHAVSEGLFTVPLNFGSDQFHQALWLECDVRPGAGSGVDPYDTLTPRQRLSPAPLALALPGLRTEEVPDESPNVVGGSSGNWILPGVYGATIAGGGNTGEIGPIKITDNFGTVGGGLYNAVGNNEGTTSDASYATVGGGFANAATATHATVAGGSNNTVKGYAGAAGGGWNCDALGRYATTPGGNNNFAGGDWSFAAGRAATVRHGDPDWYQASLYSGDADGDEGTFVWADSTHDFNDQFVSTGPNQFLISAAGGVGINTNSPKGPLHIQSTLDVNADSNYADRIAPLVVGDGDGVGSALLVDGNQVESAGDGDLVLNLNSAGDVRLVEGGGRVGIRTSNFGDEQMAIRGKVRVYDSSQARSVQTWVGSSGAVIDAENAYLQLRTNGVDRVFISTNGNVGVGTTGPSDKLHVVGTARVSALRFSDGTFQDTGAPTILSGTTTYDPPPFTSGGGGQFSVTVPGASINDVAFASPQITTTTIVVGNVRVSAPDTVTIQLINAGNTTADLPSITWRVRVIK